MGGNWYCFAVLIRDKCKIGVKFGLIVPGNVVKRSGRKNINKELNYNAIIS